MACLWSWSQAVTEAGSEPSLSDCQACAGTASMLPPSPSPESTQREVWPTVRGTYSESVSRSVVSNSL